MDNSNHMKLMEDMFNDYYRKVRGFFVGKIGNEYDAEDLTSKVFLRCYENIDKFDPSKGSESTWIFTIARNLLKNYYRDRKVTASIDNMEGFEIVDDVDVEEEIGHAERLEEIRAFLDPRIDKLDGVKRQILMMRYYDEMNSKDIAQVMHMTAGNVRIILKRTLDKLRVEAGEDNVIKMFV